MFRRISPGIYCVNIRGREEIFTCWRLKPYVPYKDDKKVPLHYHTDREGLIETTDYVVERVLEDRVVRGKRQWRVKYRGSPNLSGIMQALCCIILTTHGLGTTVGKGLMCLRQICAELLLTFFFFTTYWQVGPPAIFFIKFSPL